MSTIKTNNAQIGQSLTATNNFTWYQPASPDGTVRLGNGNAGSVTDLVVLNSSGNLGLGIAPSAWGTSVAIDLNAAANAAYISSNKGLIIGANYYNAGATNNYKTSAYSGRYYITSTTGQHQWFTAPSGTAGSAITFTQAMTLDASGRLGIAETSPADKLDIGGGLLFGGGNNDAIYTTDRDFYIKTNGANNLIFRTSNTERMRINSSGNLLVGTTNSAGKLTVAQTGVAWAESLFHSNAGTQYFTQFVYGSTEIGGIRGSNTSVAYATSSDYRLKENIQPMQNALGVVTQLRPVTYTWKADGSDGQGFIAHELQEHAPYAVTGEKDGEQMQAVDYGKITPLLTAALQEAMRKIEQLEARIATLEAK